MADLLDEQKANAKSFLNDLFIGGGILSTTETKRDPKQNQTNYSKPDNDIVDQLRKQSIMTWVIPPDLIEGLSQTELATSIVSGNLIVAKNVQRKQEIFNPQLTKFVRLNIKYSESIKEMLVEEIKQNIKDVNITKQDIEDIYGIEIDESQIDNIKISVALQIFISTLDVTLPAPVTVNMEQQSEEFNKATEAYKTAIESYINSDFFNTDIAGDVSGSVDAFKAMILARLQREWMAKKGYMSELAALGADDADGEKQLDLLQDTLTHIRQMTKNSTIIMTQLKPMIAAANKDLENASIDSEGADATSSDSSSDESSDDGDDTGGDDMGGMDMDMGDDAGSDDGGADAGSDAGFDDTSEPM